jgi:hypothetical protein
MVAAAVGLPLALRTRLRVENLGKVRVGMTQAEVEDLLGGPPGNYGMSGGSVETSASISDRTGTVLRMGRIWRGDGVTILVWFADGKVCEVPNRSPAPAGLTDWIEYPLAFWIWGFGKNNWGGPHPHPSGG